MKTGSTTATITRRSLLGAGGFVIALQVSSVGWAVSLEDDAPFGAFIHIGRDGTVTFVGPTVEIGQGAYTAGAQIIAEELDCPLAAMRVVAAPPDDTRYANPSMHLQLTAASSGIRGFYGPLRQAGSSARARLIAAAARRWHVTTAECDTSAGQVLHRASGRALPYGALADLAAREPAPDPAKLVLKPAREFTVVGHSAPRLDVPGKADGSAIYGTDVVRPGMKIAAVNSAPMVGGRLAHVDPAPALAVPGVRAVFPLAEAVAVLADHSWAAIKGLAALEPQWIGGDTAMSDASMRRDLLAASRNTPPLTSKSEGDVDGALHAAAEQLDVDYMLPLLAHAQLEPIGAVVELDGDGCDIWLGTQAPTKVQRAAAAAAGLKPEQVRVHNQLVGGGFGRRVEVDFVPLAIEIARRAGVPVKMIWTREQDMRASMMRPLFHHRLTVGIGADGKPAGWSHRITGGSVFAHYLPELFAKGLPDPNAVEGARELIYAVGPTRLDYIRHDPPVPISWWRGVGPAHNMFVIEGVVNELAHRAGVDPVAYRRRLIADPRARRVLDLAAQKGSWGAALPTRTGRGIAVQKAFGGYLACVIEAEVDDALDVRVRRVVAAVDCGQAINPDQIAAQIEGAVIFGLSAALWGEINVADGRIVQDNFNSYRVMRIDETPAIETYLVPSSEAPGGIGEAGTAIVFPALAEAIFAATGKRLRSLPFNRHSDLTAWVADMRSSGEIVSTAAMPVASRLLSDEARPGDGNCLS